MILYVLNLNKVMLQANKLVFFSYYVLKDKLTLLYFLGPINEQVLALMNTFSTQNAQLKLDVSRYKRRWTEAANNLATVSLIFFL